MKMILVDNTKAAAEDSPLDTLVELLDGGIEAQESRGQAELVLSSVLPARMLVAQDVLRPGEVVHESVRARQILSAWGVSVREAVEGDPIFVHVELPTGWRKVPTAHSMWSDLVDAAGRVRASIFYKAAFYDRDSHMTLLCRFAIRSEFRVPCDLASGRRYVITDGDAPRADLFASEWSDELAELGGMHPAAAQAYAWLDQHRPNWRDPLAYWEEP